MKIFQKFWVEYVDHETGQSTMEVTPWDETKILVDQLIADKGEK